MAANELAGKKIAVVLEHKFIPEELWAYLNGFKLLGAEVELVTRLWYGDYKPDYNDMLSAFGFEDGEIHIEKIDIEKGLVNASFFGTLTNGHEKHLITEGKIINGKLRSGITKY